MPRFHFDHLWRVLWQTATSDALLSILLLTLALAVLLAAWLPQVGDVGPAADVAWQAKVQDRFGNLAWFDSLRPILEATGVFDVFDAAWLRVLLALLAWCLLARLTDAVEALGLPHLPWRAAPEIGGPVGQGQQNGPPDDAAWRIIHTPWDEGLQALRRRRLRMSVLDQGDPVEGAPARSIRVDRWPWGELGPALVYLGGLLILASLALTGAGGWQTGSLAAMVGERVALRNGDERTLFLTKLSPDGRRGAGEIWRGQDRRVGAGELAVGRPLSGGGVSVYLVGSGPGLRVRATLSDTQALELTTGPDREPQADLTIALAGDESRRLVAAPDADLALLFSAAGPEDGAPPLHVQVFGLGSGQLITERDILTDTVLTVEQVAFDLAVMPYAQVRAVRDPGVWWGRLGLLALLLGAGLWAGRPPRRLWMRQHDDGVQVTGDLDLFPAYLLPENEE